MELRPIAILSDEVINQIAAGEVVERPASVVKELVENALDAGARQITIEIEAGGKRLIRVLDDGIGMTEAEARLGLQRHATSKLRGIDDLFTLQTMGFRGEALPSIASVCRMTLITRSRHEGADAPATRLVIQGGVIAESGEVGAPPGTHIEVTELLSNVPARLKFLKGDATEASHVNDVVNRLAMAHPEVHFRLKHRSRTTINAPGHSGRLERARALLGSRVGRHLHEVRCCEGGVSVVAFLAAPEQAQSTSRGLQLFVGRRSVRDRGLMHAVLKGYDELIPRGRYPVAIVFVDVPNPTVDVNVHPQKLEVRFSEPQRVYAAVRHAVMKGVASAPWLDDAVSEARGDCVRMQLIASTAPPRARASEMGSDYARQRNRLLLPWSDRQRERDRSYRQAHFPLAPALATSAIEVEDRTEPRPHLAEPLTNPQAADPVPVPDPAEGFFSRLRYLGQLDRTFLVCEGDGELVLIDQHVAHERVELARLKERFGSHAMPVQRLLFPQTVDLDDAERKAVDRAQDELAAVGFEVEAFGGNTYALKAVPAGLRSAEPVEVFRKLVRELADQSADDNAITDDGRTINQRLDSVFATIACHSVVRAGDSLADREAEALLSSMDSVDFRAHCPHGRPVLLRVGVSEISRRFGRS